jgi:hypothetical protein
MLVHTDYILLGINNWYSLCRFISFKVYIWVLKMDLLYSVSILYIIELNRK